LRKIRRERDRADRITDFMTNMFKVSDPSQARGNDIRVREILDKASVQAVTGLADDPEDQAQLMQVMGVVYDNLGLYPQAESLTRRALDAEKLPARAARPKSIPCCDAIEKTKSGLALPALKRVIRVETLSQSAKALFPPHKCGGSCA
jgi:hypothetical protein